MGNQCELTNEQQGQKHVFIYLIGPCEQFSPDATPDGYVGVWTKTKENGLTTPLTELHNSKSLMHLTCQVCNYFHCIVLVRVTDDKRLLHMYAHKLSRPLAVEPSNVLAHKIVKTSVLRFCTRQDLASKTFPGWAPGCAIVQWCNTECGYSNCSPVQAVTGKKNLGKFGKTKKLETLFFFLTRALSSFPVLDCPSLFYIESCMRKVHAWMCTIHHKGPSLRDGRPPENL